MGIIAGDWFSGCLCVGKRQPENGIYSISGCLYQAHKGSLKTIPIKIIPIPKSRFTFPDGDNRFSFATPLRYAGCLLRLRPIPSHKFIGRRVAQQACAVAAVGFKHKQTGRAKQPIFFQQRLMLGRIGGNINLK